MAVRDKDKRRTHRSSGAASTKGQPDEGGLSDIEAVLEALEQYQALQEIYNEALNSGQIDPQTADKISEAQRVLEDEIKVAREKQLIWIEHLGPPDGWVRTDDLVAEGWSKSSSNTMDSSSVQGNTEQMTEISDYRKELELRDELLRKELAIRQEAFQRELDARDRVHAERSAAVLSRIDDRDKVIDSKLDGISTKISDITSKVDGFDAKVTDSVHQVRKSNRASLGGMLTIGIAIVLGVWGVNSTIISSATGIFNSGQEAQKTQSANEQMLKDTQELLKQLKAVAPALPQASGSK